MSSGGEQGAGPAREGLRAELDRTRHEIDRTIAQIEQRLGADRVREVVTDRVREATGPWREQPVDQLEAVWRQTTTRVREMAWMNPIGLATGAVILGYLLGRRARSR